MGNETPEAKLARLNDAANETREAKIARLSGGKLATQIEHAAGGDQYILWDILVYAGGDSSHYFGIFSFPHGAGYMLVQSWVKEFDLAFWLGRGQNGQRQPDNKHYIWREAMGCGKVKNENVDVLFRTYCTPIIFYHMLILCLFGETNFHDIFHRNNIILSCLGVRQLDRPSLGV